MQILDVPVPQMDRLVDVLRLFDPAIPEQFVAVPKISCPSRPCRAALAATRMAEHLMEVPTDVVFLPELSFPSSVEQIIDIPVPGRVFLAMEVFKVFTQDRVPFSRLSSKSLAFQFLVGVFKFFSQIRVQQLLSKFCPKSRLKVFSHFSPGKKVRLPSTACAMECRRCSSCGYGRPCVHAATLGLATVEVPQIQFIAGVSGHSSSQQRQVRFQRGYGGDVFLSFLGIF